MKAVWKIVAAGLTKAAVWCVKHPDEVIAIVNATKKDKGK